MNENFIKVTWQPDENGNPPTERAERWTEAG